MASDLGGDPGSDPTSQRDASELRLVAKQYVAELIAEVGEPGPQERARVGLIARRIQLRLVERSI